MSFGEILRVGVVTLCAFLAPLPVAAHGSETHAQTANPPSETAERSVPDPEPHELTAPSSPLSEFPTWHPLVVHFPIVLLLLAPMFELSGLVLRKRDLRTAAMLLAVGGLAGAFVAAQVVHPHTTGLGMEAQQILAAHERYAVLAQWAALLAVLARLGGYLVSGGSRVLDLVTLVLLLVAAGAVSGAGHYGGELTHLHGVGPRGAYLEHH